MALTGLLFAHLLTALYLNKKSDLTLCLSERNWKRPQSVLDKNPLFVVWQLEQIANLNAQRACI